MEQQGDGGIPGLDRKTILPEPNDTSALHGPNVESSMRAEGPRLRITSKLIRIRDHAVLWSTSYDIGGFSVALGRRIGGPGRREDTSNSAFVRFD